MVLEAILADLDSVGRAVPGADQRGAGLQAHRCRGRRTLALSPIAIGQATGPGHQLPPGRRSEAAEGMKSRREGEDAVFGVGRSIAKDQFLRV